MRRLASAAAARWSRRSLASAAEASTSASAREAPADTIFALSTAPGRAGVAVVRVSGPATHEVLRLLPPASGAADSSARARARRPRHREARPTAFVCPDTGETLDRGILLWFDGPRSFTGEDVAELHVHGSQAVVRAVLAALGRLRPPDARGGAVRHAEPGEFTRRAFRNGKLDLTQAEGLADLLDAETEAQRRQALSQAGGELRRTYERWRRTLLRAHAHVEATLDFGEDDELGADVFRAASSEAGPVAALRAELEAHLRAPPSGELTRLGVRVCLVGPPNAGKSSLLNALAGRAVAIVSDAPGTTRDAVETSLVVGGRKAVVADTAGARDASDPVEAEGVRRAERLAADADVVVLVLDGASFEGVCALPRWALERADVLVLNKADLGEADDAPLRDAAAGRLGADSASRAAAASRRRVATSGASVGPKEDAARVGVPTARVSCATGHGLDALADVLRAAVEARAGEVAGDGAGVAAITRSRHRARLRECVHHLVAFAAAAASETGRHEVAAEELRLAARALGRVTGAVDVEELLDVIFSDFCIGK
jgi:tRNA modification GTPase